MNIYVSNLSFNVQDNDLKNLFSPYGEVTSARVVTDKFSGKSRGFGFVEMPDTTASNNAIAALNNSTVESRQIAVSEARPKEDRPAKNNSPFTNDRNSGYNKNRW